MGCAFFFNHARFSPLECVLFEPLKFNNAKTVCNCLLTQVFVSQSYKIELDTSICPDLLRSHLS